MMVMRAPGDFASDTSTKWYYRKFAPVLGMAVIILHEDGARVNPKGTIIRLREPFGTVDIKLQSGEIRYCVTNDPYAKRSYWTPDKC